MDVTTATGTVPETLPPPVPVAPDQTGTTPPVRSIDPVLLQQLGQNLSRLFEQYVSDRRVAELKWLRNLRQYLGEYDPEIEKQLEPKRSRAYPKITRVKTISTLSRIMNLMFPGNERNWELKASPNAEMAPEDVLAAVQEYQRKNAEIGVNLPVDVQLAVQQLANERAEGLSTVLDDQLQELGGDQTLDYVSLNRKVALSGILYGLGVLQGPFVRAVKRTVWEMMPTPAGAMPIPRTVDRYKPIYEFLPVWDFYPDMSAKTLANMDGYFVRKVMSRSQLRELANRPDFFGEQIRTYLSTYTTGNYKPQPYETDLRAMGVKVNVNEQKAETSKYEVVAWYGPITGQMLRAAGAVVADDALGDDIEAEVWMVGNTIIKAVMNPWRQIGVNLKTIHTFLFDEDDTAPVGNGLPNIMRDSQMSISAASRMLLDNASVVCGPNMELNMDLLMRGQDVNSVYPHKVWYREGMGAEAAVPAVRAVMFDGHMDELMQVIELFMKFADAETFVGPATGGDMEKAPSEPMRTAAGASMLRGDAALPFKDIVRNFDFFTQSLIASMVAFNRKLNPDLAPEGDYDVIARGATSLIAKEIRGIQVDTLAVSLTPEERDYVDEQKLVEARFKVRDLGDMLLPPDEVKRNKAARAQAAQQAQEAQQRMIEAQIREVLSAAFKNVTQGQKNTAAADAQTVNAGLDILETAIGPSDGKAKSSGSGGKGTPAKSGNTSR